MSPAASTLGWLSAACSASTYALIMVVPAFLRTACLALPCKTQVAEHGCDGAGKRALPCPQESHPWAPAGTVSGCCCDGLRNTAPPAASAAAAAVAFREAACRQLPFPDLWQPAAYQHLRCPCCRFTWPSRGFEADLRSPDGGGCEGQETAAPTPLGVLTVTVVGAKLEPRWVAC